LRFPPSPSSIPTRIHLLVSCHHEPPVTHCLPRRPSPPLTWAVATRRCCTGRTATMVERRERGKRGATANYCSSCPARRRVRPLPTPTGTLAGGCAGRMMAMMERHGLSAIVVGSQRRGEIRGSRGRGAKAAEVEVQHDGRCRWEWRRLGPSTGGNVAKAYAAEDYAAQRPTPRLSRAPPHAVGSRWRRPIMGRRPGAGRENAALPPLVGEHGHARGRGRCGRRASMGGSRGEATVQRQAHRAEERPL